MSAVSNGDGHRNCDIIRGHGRPCPYERRAFDFSKTSYGTGFPVCVTPN